MGMWLSLRQNKDATFASESMQAPLSFPDWMSSTIQASAEEEAMLILFAIVGMSTDWWILRGSKNVEE